ncbi:MAG: hypothetical protein HC780_25860, partial [Leptolyngbyaceae cyanobacterium CSU_1_3]|nr:hypothetical protein [Leptolyngbyaceae cyanobacterium CSU_1_3]
TQSRPPDALLKSALLRRYRKGRTTNLSTFAPLTRSALLTTIERLDGVLRCASAPYKSDDRTTRSAIALR